MTGAPTGTQQLNYTIAFDELAAEIAKLRALEPEMKKFEQQMEAAGVAYTPAWPAIGQSAWGLRCQGSAKGAKGAGCAPCTT